MKGVPAVAHLGNPRGFIPVDGKCRHTKHKNIFAVGVAVAIAPPEQTAIPTGVPKTGFMTVKMAKTAAYSIAAEISGKPCAGILRNGCPLPYGHGQYCGIDEGKTLAPAKAGV